jgi:prophage tail gpP-like protein
MSDTPYDLSPDLGTGVAQDFNGVRGMQDRVELLLGSDKLRLSEEYSVHTSVLTQPAAFTMKVGWTDSLVSLLKKYPPRTRFQLLVNGHVYQTGFVDGFDTTSGPTALTYHGRDAMAELHDAFVEEEFSIHNPSYAEIVRKCLDDAGYKGVPVAYTNRPNRQAMLGAKKLAADLKPPRDVENEKIDTAEGGKVKHDAQAKMGEKFYDFIQRHITRAGLFLWVAADGTFVLSEPNPNQQPLYQILRLYGSETGSTVVGDGYRNSAEGRYAEVRVYIRGQSKKKGRPVASGSYSDPEMKAWGYTKKMVIRDADADSPKKAEYMARRTIAATRRAGWRLQYTVMGHTTTSYAQEKVVWTPDTVVYVHDDKLGIDGNYYVEGVTLASKPFTTATLDLMRLEDLVFSEIGPAAADAPALATSPTALEF